MFILPKSILKRVNQLCRAFIWKADAEMRGGATLVSWDTMCQLKTGGGWLLKIL